MAIHLRRLVTEDLAVIEQMAKEKLVMTNTKSFVFEDNGVAVFKYFVLPDSIYGAEKMRCYGYFEDEKLLAVLGLRTFDQFPSWILSFIVTSTDCKNSIASIKFLLEYTMVEQEKLGYYQWFTVSKLDKFDVWQKLFKEVRQRYHHYVYARIPANTMPKWLGHLNFSRGKLFPYDINISMYMAKSLCTSDGDDSDVDERDIDFL
jgi:hypothetical protein